MQPGDGGQAQAEGVEVVVSVTAALRRELDALGLSGDQEPPLAASALALAARLDDPDTPATAIPACARELREALTVLETAKRDGEQDRMSEFERRLAARA